jgi:hypothetical protein
VEAKMDTFKGTVSILALRAIAVPVALVILVGFFLTQKRK